MIWYPSTHNNDDVAIRCGFLMLVVFQWRKAEAIVHVTTSVYLLCDRFAALHRSHPGYRLGGTSRARIGNATHQASTSLITYPIQQPMFGAPVISLSPQLVACVGSGRSGSLAVLRNGIVAEVLIEVPVPDIEAVWALKFHDDTEHMSLAVTPYATDAYHVISTATGTMVLQSGEELEEVSDK